MDFEAFLRYWALTLAVFVFYIFALVVASLDVFANVAETARKRRGERKPIVLDPNPLAGKSIAKTIFPGPGQQLDERRAWVARLAEEIVRKVNPSPPVETLVLEDSKGHPLVHFSNGTRLETYRFDHAHIEAAMAGDASRVAEVSERLTLLLMADFLGKEEVRPPRTTELARETAAKPAAAKAAAAPMTAAPDSLAASTGAAAEAEPSQKTPAEPKAAAAPGTPAAQPASDPESMSREERLAAARAKAEALRAARQAQKPADI
jgi:hypothetical protein